MYFGFETTGDEVVQTFQEVVANKTILITGPSPGGIGAETALALAQARPRQLILAGRSRSKIQPLIDQLADKTPDIKVAFLQLDLGSQRSVRAAAGEVKNILVDNQIDILILNAAIMACPYSLTEDGIESQFATNHIGHFLFSNLLLKQDLVRSRIVVVSSSASHRKAEVFMPHLKDLSYSSGKTYDAVVAYGVSKACNILYAKRLARSRLVKERKISTFSLNPGSILTNLQVHMTAEVRNKAIEAAKRDDPDFQAPVRKTLQQGCATQLRAALDPSLASSSGSYLDDCQVVVRPEHVNAEAYMDEVWEISERLVGEKFDF